jgi:hypothetical protein
VYQHSSDSAYLSYMHSVWWDTQPCCPIAGAGVWCSSSSQVWSLCGSCGSQKQRKILMPLDWEWHRFQTTVKWSIVVRRHWFPWSLHEKRPATSMAMLPDGPDILLMHFVPIFGSDTTTGCTGIVLRAPVLSIFSCFEPILPLSGIIHGLFDTQVTWQPPPSTVRSAHPSATRKNYRQVMAQRIFKTSKHDWKSASLRVLMVSVTAFRTLSSKNRKVTVVWRARGNTVIIFFARYSRIDNAIYSKTLPWSFSSATSIWNRLIPFFWFRDHIFLFIVTPGGTDSLWGILRE